MYLHGRHLRIRYDDNQPIQNLQQQNEIRQEIDNQQNEETQQETELKENNDISDAAEELPRNIAYTQQETPSIHATRNTNKQYTTGQQFTTNGGRHTNIRRWTPYLGRRDANNTDIRNMKDNKKYRYRFHNQKICHLSAKKSV